ncbi:MAG: diguanylate cyclase, partial [Frankiales bacterium]|nr:diguanylate cyclase [Frankiales bacterium]
MTSPTRRAAARGSVRRLFAIYAVISLVPILVLGAVLYTLLEDQGAAQGMAEGRAKAELIASTSIAPQLNGADLRAGLSPPEVAALSRTADTADRDQILRLRVRDLNGVVVFPA